MLCLRSCGATEAARMQGDKIPDLPGVSEKFPCRGSQEETVLVETKLFQVLKTSSNVKRAW